MVVEFKGNCFRFGGDFGLQFEAIFHHFGAGLARYLFYHKSTLGLAPNDILDLKAKS